MKTIKEMKNEIEHECEKMNYCEMCPLYNLETDCYINIRDEEVIRNYNIMFGNEEWKMLNIDKYRNEIVEIGLELGLANDHAALAYYCRMKGKVTIAFDEVIRWLFQEYKEPIQLTQFEYDFLDSLDDKQRKFYMNDRNMFMKQKGYFENVDVEMILQDVLDNYEVVKNVD